jgi:CheY-like chemotaxis protein
MQSYALIADPDATAAAAYAAAARDEGLTYVSVRDGSRALAVVAARGMPELFVIEMTLPDLDGLEVVERLRRAPGGAATSIIIVSADRAHRERAVARRADLDLGAVLSKAASLDSIRRVLWRLQIGVPGARSSETRLADPETQRSAGVPVRAGSARRGGL